MSRLLLLSLVLTTLFGNLYASAQPLFFQATPDLTADYSLLTQEACEFPCWYGIVPGESRLDDVYAKLAELEFYTSATYKNEHNYELQGPDRMITDVSWRSSQSNNNITLTDGIVSGIRIQPNIDFTLDDILDLYGEPAGMQIVYIVSSEVAYLYVGLKIFYPDEGLIVSFALYDSNTSFVEAIEINADAQGISFELYEVAEIFVAFAGNSRVLTPNPFSILEGWPGIGSIILPDRERFPYGISTILTSAGQMCCELKYTETLPRWNLFNLIPDIDLSQMATPDAPSDEIKPSL